MLRDAKNRVEVLYEQKLPITAKFFYAIDIVIKKILMGESDRRDQKFNLILFLFKKIKKNEPEYVTKELQRLNILKKQPEIGFKGKVQVILTEYLKEKEILKERGDSDRTRAKIENMQKIYSLRLLSLVYPEIAELETRIKHVYKLYGLDEFKGYFTDMSHTFGLLEKERVKELNVTFLAYISSVISLHNIPHNYIEGFTIQIFRNIYGYIPGFNLRVKIIEKLYEKIRLDDTLQYGLVSDLEYLHSNLTESEKEKTPSKFALHRKQVSQVTSKQFSNLVQTTFFVVITKGLIVAALYAIEGKEGLIRSGLALIPMIIVGFIVSRSIIIRFGQEEKSLIEASDEIYYRRFRFEENVSSLLRKFVQLYKLYASVVMFAVLFFFLQWLHFTYLEIAINLFLFSILLNSSVDIHKSIEKVILRLENVIRINYVLLIFLGFAGINDVGKWIMKRYRDTDPFLKIYSAVFSPLINICGRSCEYVKSYFVYGLIRLQNMVHNITKAGV